MQPYRLAICEDDPLEAGSLRALCEEILTQRQVPHRVRLFSSAEALAQALEQNGAAFDLLLLDIEMPGKSGMDLARELYHRQTPVRLLFITGNPAYALEGYEVHPVHYLLKPVDRDTLAEVLLRDWQTHRQPAALVLHYARKTLTLPADDILYMESHNHTVTIHTVRGDYPVPVPLADVERLAPPDRFSRCHNSYLVHLGQVAQIGRTGLLLRSGARLPVGRRYYDSFQAAFVRYINQNNP